MSRMLCQRWWFSASASLIAAVLWAAPASLEASIMLPDQLPFDDVDQILASLQASLSSSDMTESEHAESEHTPLGPPRDYQRHDQGRDTDLPDLPDRLCFLASLDSIGGGTSGSGASTSSSVSGSGGTGLCPIDAVAAFSFSDAELVAWVGVEQRFALPMPPGNDLLRPPQYWM